MYNLYRQISSRTRIENNIPVVLYGIDIINNKILGLDEIGVIAEYEDGCSYIYGGFEKDNILNFVKIEDVPEENRNEFIADIEWFPLNQVEKAN